MKHIALTGACYSGKTNLARSLEQRGYLFISFTDLLKQYAVKSLTACGIPVTLEGILKDKRLYRPYLQELGSLIGFNDNPKYVREALAVWDGEACVFDNVRTPQQWDVLKGFGFTLVEVKIDHLTQRERAANLGVTGAALGKVLQHPIEGMLDGHGDVTLDGKEPPSLNVRLLLNEEMMRR